VQSLAETEIVHKLSNPYDFDEANKEVQKNIMRQKEADAKKFAEMGTNLAA
jgi:hypothetical protein